MCRVTSSSSFSEMFDAIEVSRGTIGVVGLVLPPLSDFKSDSGYIGVTISKSVSF